VRCDEPLREVDVFHSAILEDALVRPASKSNYAQVMDNGSILSQVR
jgi:hypothetical protein